jgi:hypothetical protein
VVAKVTPARPRRAPASLRPAPVELTPDRVELLVWLADQLKAGRAAKPEAYRGPYPIRQHLTVAALDRIGSRDDG